MLIDCFDSWNGGPACGEHGGQGPQTCDYCGLHYAEWPVATMVEVGLMKRMGIDDENVCPCCVVRLCGRLPIAGIIITTAPHDMIFENFVGETNTRLTHRPIMRKRNKKKPRAKRGGKKIRYINKK